MNVQLRHLEVGEIIIIPFTGQQQIHAVIHVGTNNQRNGFFRICFYFRHILIDNIDQTIFIDDRRSITNRTRKLDRGVDEDQIVLPASSASGAKAPTPLLTRFGTTRILHSGITSRTTGFGLSNNLRIRLQVERLQPGSTTMIASERYTLTEMRRHMRPRQFAVLIKLKRMTFTRSRRNVLRCFQSRFTLGKSLVAFPIVIPYRSVIGKDLASFVIRMTGLPLGREHVLNPVFDVNDRSFFGPVAFSTINNFELLTKPVHGFTDQFV